MNSGRQWRTEKPCVVQTMGSQKLYMTERVNNNMSWWQIKKIVILKCLLLQQQWTISWSDGDMQQKVDFIQLAMTSSVVGPRSSKALPKAKLAPKKDHDPSLFVGLLPVWSTIASESQQNHYIWEVCSANWWEAPKLAMPAASICQWQPTPVLLPGKPHGRRNLVGCSPWGCEESDTTEQLHFHFSLSCIGEGNGNPLQYSCLENPRDSGAW